MDEQSRLRRLSPPLAEASLDRSDWVLKELTELTRRELKERIPSTRGRLYEVEAEQDRRERVRKYGTDSLDGMPSYEVYLSVHGVVESRQGMLAMRERLPRTVSGLRCCPG